MPVSVQEDPSLTAGQVSMRIGAGEREIDTQRLLMSVRDAVDAFFYQINKEAMNE